MDIRDDELVFTRYPFKYSAVAKRGARVDAGRIGVVFDSSSDVAFVLDCREVIFLPKELKAAFHKFAKRNGIEKAQSEDVWVILADPYIDQPYEAADEGRDYRRLQALGFSESEVRRIRREIRSTMLRSTLYTIKWGFYTTQDVLRAFALLSPRLFTEKLYWWVTEIALRNYCVTSRQAPTKNP